MNRSSGKRTWLSTSPLIGWTASFATRGVEVVEDDLGRPSVPRRVLGDLLTEDREREARLATQRAERAVAGYPAIPVGIPALENGSPLESLVAHDPGYSTPQAEFGRPAPRFLEEELEAGARQQAAARAEVESRKAKDR